MFSFVNFLFSNSSNAMSRLCLPLILTIAIAPVPIGVEMLAIVSIAHILAHKISYVTHFLCKERVDFNCKNILKIHFYHKKVMKKYKQKKPLVMGLFHISGFLFYLFLITKYLCGSSPLLTDSKSG